MIRRLLLTLAMLAAFGVAPLALDQLDAGTAHAAYTCNRYKVTYSAAVGAGYVRVNCSVGAPNYRAATWCIYGPDPGNLDRRYGPWRAAPAVSQATCLAGWSQTGPADILFSNG